MKRKNYAIPRLLIATAIFAFIQTGCQKETTDDLQMVEDANTAIGEKGSANSYTADVAITWYNLELKLIKETAGHTPPIAARDLGYTGIALYESLVGGIKNSHTLVGQLNGLSSLPTRIAGEKYAPPICANAAMANVIRSLYANASAANLARIDSLENANDLNNQAGFDAARIQRSRDFGHSIGDAIFNWSTTDGGHQAYLNNFPTSYVPPTGPGFWVPTYPSYSIAMLPYWGSNRTFVPANGPGPVDPPAPPAYSTNPTSPFYLAAMEVYNTSNNLTQAQMDIANYWADGGATITPPGHNLAIVAQTIQENNFKLGQAAILFAKAGIAENDVGIVCWRSKYNVSLLRPITYIRANFNANWNSYIGTPPFPSYTSGHSSFSGACSRILESRFGKNYAFTDNTKVPYGFAPRSFTSFHAFAEEAAVSRLYGGIHYTFDNVNGYNCGILIANNVLALNW